jgi:hypothetical protein
MSPLCESIRPADEMDQMEPFYPLSVYVCAQCFLVQLAEYVTPEAIFSEYAYFSSFSDSWLAHAADYTQSVTDRLGLTDSSFVVELASNDGYLLRNFVDKGIPCLGIEPAANVARAAIEQGVDTLVEFFGEATARQLAEDGKQADLIIGNNVLAQVPDLNDFVGGCKILLKPTGVVTMEFPHLLQLMRENQFDTIYHEHFSYFSLLTAESIFARHGLVLFDVDEIPTHGGSLRIYARHTQDESKPVEERVKKVLHRERKAGFDSLEGYAGFSEQVAETKRDLLSFLIEAKRAGKRIAGYGAPGKGNTLLNYCGIRTDYLDYTVDRNPYKHGKFLPGTHIPVFPPEKLAETRPDYILILPWNLRDEIVKQLEYARKWGAQTVVPIPRVEVVEWPSQKGSRR